MTVPRTLKGESGPEAVPFEALVRILEFASLN